MMMRHVYFWILLYISVSCSLLYLCVLFDHARWHTDEEDTEILGVRLSQLETTPNRTTISHPPIRSAEKISCNRSSKSSSPLGTTLLTVGFIGRMGNNMFQYASLLGLAKSNNRIPFILPDSLLARTFRISHIRTVSNPEKWRPLIREKSYAVYDSTLNCLPPGNLTMQAYLQSYRYFDTAKDLVRSEFKFLPRVERLADGILRYLLSQYHQRASSKNLTLIGVHVRRGDKTLESERAQGYMTAPAAYFKNAFDLMRKKYNNVLFLVASDDPTWVTTFLKADDVKLLPQNQGQVHLCVLTQCDHVIMSVGTFGWWAGFLAGGDVIYYNQPIAPGSGKYPHFDVNDHFPKEWIGLGA